MGHLFISYAREDRKEAWRLKNALEKDGFTIWIDTEDLHAGEGVSSAIEKALVDADRVLVIWTRLSVRKSYVLKEAEFALEKKKLTPLTTEAEVNELGLGFLFAGIETPSFFDWTGSRDEPVYRKFVDSIDLSLGRKPREWASAESTVLPRDGGARQKSGHELARFVAVRFFLVVTASFAMGSLLHDLLLQDHQARGEISLLAAAGVLVAGTWLSIRTWRRRTS